MNNVLQAINILLALMEVMNVAAQKIERINKIIKSAREEGRDISDEELQEIYDERKAAMDEWKKAK